MERVGKNFGVLYDTTFDAILDPHDVRFGHEVAHIPSAPAPFKPLAQRASTGGVCWTNVLLGTAAIGIVAYICMQQGNK